MDKLNSDMVSEIGSRLPIKSVLQSRKVCKIWRSILGKPKTGTFFADRPKYCSGYINIYHRADSSETVNFNRIEEPQKIYKIYTWIPSYSYTVVGICNGLVCYRKRDYDPRLGEFMFISNPIASERIRLPIPKTGTVDCDCAGFGYCRSADVYKVVKIGKTENFKQNVQVYTLGDGRGWRDKPEITYTLQESGVYANGALHWISKKPNCSIVAFDVADETFQSIPSPSCRIPSKSYMHATLGSLEGNLYLCLPYEKQGKHLIDIWVFKKKNMNNCRQSTRVKERTYSNSFTWIKLFSGECDSELNSMCHPLSITKSEILLWQNGALHCYDLKRTKKLWCARSGDAQKTPYMQSLVSLKDLGEGRVDCNFVRPRQYATR